MIPERFDPTVARPVVWSPAPARVNGLVPSRSPAWLTSLAAAGLALIVFTLTLVVLAALLLPAAV